MHKSLKILYASTSILAMTAGIIGVTTPRSIVNTNLSPNQASKPDNKYYYDDKYFNSMEEVTSYYLFKNDIVNSDFYLGSVNDAIYDYTNGFLDATKLYPVDYSKTSNAYTNAYGGYERTKQEALDTFINETRMVTKYSDYNGGLFYEYDQALDSLRSKTEDYKIVYNKINTNSGNIDINPLNPADQNELKTIALNEVMTKKENSPFSLSYYYDNASQIETLTNLNNLGITASLNDIIAKLKTEIQNVFKYNIRYKGTVNGIINGVGDYDVYINGAGRDRIVATWGKDNAGGLIRRIEIYDLTPDEVEALSIFESTAPPLGGGWIDVYSTESKCCPVNNVSSKKRVYLGNTMIFDFEPSKNTMNWYHSKHGLWFGPAGYECGVIDPVGGNGMTFQSSASPSYLFNQSGYRFDLTNWNSSAQRIVETYAFILDIAIKNLFANLQNNYDVNELNFILDASKTAMLTAFGTESLFENQLNTIPANSNKYRFSSFYNRLYDENYFKSDNEKTYEMFNYELIYTLSKQIKSIINYNNRPLYEVDFYGNLTNEQVINIRDLIKEKYTEEIPINMSFYDVLSLIYNNVKNNFDINESLINVSQNVKLNEQINTGSQLTIYKQNQTQGLFKNNFEGFVPVALPSINVEGVSNRITNILPNQNDEYYINNILYYYSRNNTMLNQTELNNIPLLYGLNGDQELYISAYLGNSFDNNVAMSQAGMTLYPNEYALQRAKQNLNSLKPSKVHLVIGPNGKPLPIGSSPGSDGFYNSFENVLINAGFEFSLKPSEKFIFYEDKLINNDFNLVYNLNIKQKSLYFADYTKLLYYVQEILKLEVKVI